MDDLMIDIDLLTRIGASHLHEHIDSTMDSGTVATGICSENRERHYGLCLKIFFRPYQRELRRKERIKNMITSPSHQNTYQILKSSHPNKAQSLCASNPSSHAISKTIRYSKDSVISTHPFGNIQTGRNHKTQEIMEKMIVILKARDSIGRI